MGYCSTANSASNHCRWQSQNLIGKKWLKQYPTKFVLWFPIPCAFHRHVDNDYIMGTFFWCMQLEFHFRSRERLVLWSFWITPTLFEYMRLVQCPRLNDLSGFWPFKFWAFFWFVCVPPWSNSKPGNRNQDEDIYSNGICIWGAAFRQVCESFISSISRIDLCIGGLLFSLIAIFMSKSSFFAVLSQEAQWKWCKKIFSAVDRCSGLLP